MHSNFTIPKAVPSKCVCVCPYLVRRWSPTSQLPYCRSLRKYSNPAMWSLRQCLCFCRDLIRLSQTICACRGCSLCGRSSLYNINHWTKFTELFEYQSLEQKERYEEKRKSLRSRILSPRDAFLQGAGHCSSLAPLLAGKKEPGGNVSNFRHL